MIYVYIFLFINVFIIYICIYIFIYLVLLVTDARQSAYRQYRSTEDAMISLIDTLPEHLDQNAQSYVGGVFIAFTSAFNTISPTILIDKLKQIDLHANWIYIGYTAIYATDLRG